MVTAASTVAPADMTVPVGVPQTFDEHIKLQFDLQALAFQADITRVSTVRVSVPEVIATRKRPGPVLTVEASAVPGAGFSWNCLTRPSSPLTTTPRPVGSST